MSTIERKLMEIIEAKRRDKRKEGDLQQSEGMDHHHHFDSIYTLRLM